MPWRPLAEAREPRWPKLWNLRRAARGGLSVPSTCWLPARAALPARFEPPPSLRSKELIVRSVSPLEDRAEGSGAGRFESRSVAAGDRAGFAAAVEAVAEAQIAAAPQDPGALMVQPLLRPERGGVAFTDGFYWERSQAPGGNRGLTSGRERGQVERGGLLREDPWSAFLERIAAIFARDLAEAGCLDIEFAADGPCYTLLQVRPVRFRVARNPLLSLANHREILGDLPSPWVLAALERAGSGALGYFARIDPEIARWGEAYAVRAAGRAWLNFSVFFRMMDRWGLPRGFVTEGIGGAQGPESAGGVRLGRLLLHGPRLVRLQLANLRTLVQIPQRLKEFERTVAEARSLPELFAANVAGLELALTTNFALNGALTGWIRVRRGLGIAGRAEVVTERMQAEYEALLRSPAEARGAALDAWLERYGHRGPLESDPARPRFGELRELLAADLDRRSDRGAAGAPGPIGATEGAPRRAAPRSSAWLFWLDRRRESFRDELMRVWARMRARILAAAAAACRPGGLAEPADVFLLEPQELAALERPEGLATLLAQRREERRRLALLALPHTADLEAIRAAEGAGPHLRGSATPGAQEAQADPWLRGVGLGQRAAHGRVLLASDLVGLLEREREAGRPLLDRETILVATALEPAWAVVFGRVGGVVTELGGELSHVAILLREAGVPALLDVRGATARLVEGERVLLEPAQGRLRRLDRAEGSR